MKKKLFFSALQPWARLPGRPGPGISGRLGSGPLKCEKNEKKMRKKMSLIAGRTIKVRGYRGTVRAGCPCTHGTPTTYIPHLHAEQLRDLHRRSACRCGNTCVEPKKARIRGALILFKNLKLQYVPPNQAVVENDRHCTIVKSRDLWHFVLPF